MLRPAVLTAALAAILAAPASSLRIPAAPGCAIFPASNPWNRRVDTLPVARNSAVVVRSIGLDTGLHPDAAVGVEEGFFLMGAQAQIGAQNTFDGRHDLVIGKARTSLFADRRSLGRIAAERDLVVFDTRPIQPQKLDSSGHASSASRVHATVASQ